MPATTRSGTDSWSRALGRALVGVTGALVAIELVLRQAYFVPPDYDPIFGPVIRAGSTVHFAREGVGTSRWTVHGLRHATPPDPSRPAVVALGDSYTEALGVDDEYVFTHQLERRLEPRMQVQILNAGRAGASITDYIALAPLYKETYHPRWMIIQLREKDLTTDAWDTTKDSWAHFKRGKDGGIEIVPGHLEPRGRLWHAVDPLRATFASFTFAIIRYREFKAAAEAEPPLFFAGSSHEAPNLDGNRILSHDEAQKFPIAEEIEMLEAAYDGHLTMLYLPDFDPTAPLRVGSLVEETLDRLCTERGYSCVNIRSSYADFAARHVAPFGFPNSGYNFGHMNALGHTASAEALDRELTERLRDLL